MVDVLANETVGTFLLRPSPKPGCISMSIVEGGPGGRSLAHAIVNVHPRPEGDAGTGYSFERTGKVFGSLDAMIAALDGVGEPYVAAYDETAVTLKGT